MPRRHGHTHQRIREAGYARSTSERLAPMEAEERPRAVSPYAGPVTAEDFVRQFREAMLEDEDDTAELIGTIRADRFDARLR